MRFDLSAPCGNCPFRSDKVFHLHTERVEEICDAITTGDKTFACHKTTKQDDDGCTIPHRREQHCAGALILLEKMRRPNQLIRIAYRLGIYDKTKLKMDSPVFENTNAMIDHYFKQNKGR